MRQLAGLLRDGRGGPKDHKEAFRLYSQAAGNGDAQAMGSVGEMHEAGQGVAKKDEKAAAAWYLKASDAGWTPALLSLGRLHAEGRGTQKNEAEARALFHKAAKAEGAASVWANVLWLFERPELGLDRRPPQTATLMLLALAEDPRHRERLLADAAKIPQAVRVALQRQLKTSGHYTGPVSGTFDPATKAALEAWAARPQGTAR
jgi:TPR repeat protein